MPDRGGVRWSLFEARWIGERQVLTAGHSWLGGLDIETTA